MNFQQLEYVIAVHLHKHFGQAAEHCNITQATLSGMIKKLEEELDVKLFDRSRQPVKTTDKGLEFISIANKIIEHRNQLLNLTDRVPTKLEGKLTIGVIPTIANSLLPIILPALLKENPKLELTIKEITTEEIKKQLVMDVIDLGILATPLNDQLLEESILYYEPMMVYGVADNHKKYVTSRDIKDGQIWLLEEGHCFRNQAMTICDMKEKELTVSNLNFLGSSFDTLLNLTDEFGGITLVPELYYNSMPEEKRLRTKPFQKPIPVREVSIVYYRQYAKQQTVNFLADQIQSHVQDHLSTAQYSNSDLEIIGIA